MRSVDEPCLSGKLQLSVTVAVLVHNEMFDQAGLAAPAVEEAYNLRNLHGMEDKRVCWWMCELVQDCTESGYCSFKNRNTCLAGNVCGLT